MTLNSLKTSSGACVYRVDDDKRVEVLLVRPHQSRDAWGIPKGHIEGKERFSDAARREVYEETGIQVMLEDPLNAVYCSFNKMTKRVIAYLARQTCDTQPYPHDNENVEVRWFPIDDLPNLHLYQRPLLSDAQKLLNIKVTGVIPPSIMNCFDTVYSYASNMDDWLEIKMQVVRMLPAPDRKLFGRRHDISKLQQTNFLERWLGKIWSERTGRPIVWPRQHEE